MVIIGGGIVGCYTAYFLAREGFEVCLVERDGIASKASGNNPGGLNPLHGPGLPGVMSPLAERAFELHLEHSEAIGRFSGSEFSMRRVSRVELAFGSDEKETLIQTIPCHDTIPGFSACWLDRKELLERDQRINPEAIGGLWIEGNGMVESKLYTRAVAKAAEKHGAVLVEGEATGLEKCGGRITGVRLGHQVIDADSVVIATGSWAAAASDWLDFPIPIRPVKGDLLLVDSPGTPGDHHVTWKTMGLYQMQGRFAWLGGTQDEAGFEESTTESGRQSIIDGVARLIPSVRCARIRQHLVGLRPVSPDGLPMIGKVPGWENVYLASGSGTKGMLLGAGMADAVISLLMDRSPSFSLDPFRVDRFGES